MGSAKRRIIDGANEGDGVLARPLLSQTLDVQGLGDPGERANIGAPDLRGDPYYEGESAPARVAPKLAASLQGPPGLDDDSLMDFQPARSPPIPSLIGQQQKGKAK